MNAALSPFPDVPERIAEIIFALCQTLTMRLRTATVTQAQLTYIVGRLLGIRKRFQNLVARVRAGKPPRERARAPREAVPAPEFPLGFRPPPPGWRRWAVRTDKPVPLWRSLRQNTFAWVLPLTAAVPEFRDSAVVHRAQLLGSAGAAGGAGAAAGEPARRRQSATAVLDARHRGIGAVSRAAGGFGTRSSGSRAGANR